MINRVEIQIPEFLKGKLIKDLQENEVICEHCNGTGLAIDDNRYGIQGEYSRTLFPYSHQSIGFCKHCYNGVNRKCSYCGKILNRGSYKCDCAGYLKEQYKKEEEKEQEVFQKAEKMTYEEYTNKYPNYMIYDPFGDKYYMDLDDLEEDYYSYSAEDTLPKYVYGTTKQSIRLDVNNILEYECDNLHEDAYDNLDGIKELREAIEKFNEVNKTNTATFWMNYKIAIILE